MIGALLALVVPVGRENETRIFHPAEHRHRREERDERPPEMVPHAARHAAQFVVQERAEEVELARIREAGQGEGGDGDGDGPVRVERRRERDHAEDGELRRVAFGIESRGGHAGHCANSLRPRQLEKSRFNRS